MLDKIQQFQSDGCGTRIKVNNVPNSVSREALYTFFSAAGEVTEVQQLKPGCPGEHQQFMISFQQAETARCALTSMDGLSLGGCKIKLQPSVSSTNNNFTSPPHSFNWRPLGVGTQRDENEKFFSGRSASRPDGSNGCHSHKQVAPNSSQDKTREISKAELAAASSRKNCNLYVLNLSLDMTNESLKAIIQGSGEVKHVCVLATLDNAGRRRAFVDMATPDEACRVVENFHGKRVEGYELHISYAFIQRSGGPTVPFDGNSAAKAARPLHHDASTRPSVCRKSEERDKYYPAKKSPVFPASRSGKTVKVSKINPNTLLELNPPVQVVSPLDSSRSPESDMESVFPFTPSSSYDSGAESPEISPSVLFETSLPKHLCFSAPLVSGKAYSQWTLLVSNVSPVACIDSDDLFRFFVRQGLKSLKSAHLNVSSHSGMSLGHGTLTFDSMKEYHQAIEMINSKDISLAGARIKCAKLSRYSPSTSSPYSSASSPIASEASGLIYPFNFNSTCPASEF
ncbi:hypothetical protein PTTG_03320 [Puccinia triticina 1-1 BBBD Race 1]|uniref:RRM domain-containing protein n=2 Tax=Puccinia triticina TaxID=208348 RepID=A0A0C4ERA3_PUCT1|nr:uncharacterized protein PtA15_15A168 [Puccinia triticina]OAV91059.1 hypothetical protein PTTG_03320 [Puccinia triticina 1-1 BBBD Race 1]WAQ91776.1 hypothetical protein PtA15_15A168 [Puccinia triticina]WAR62579.1 hypothetical protein PtB15_15B165 [Puccinia triticina]